MSLGRLNKPTLSLMHNDACMSGLYVGKDVQERTEPLIFGQRPGNVQATFRKADTRLRSCFVGRAKRRLNV
jgi:hypothetical protein